MTRILVAQAVPRSLFEGEGAPLLVGALAWAAELPPLREFKDRIGPSAHQGITFIVKATFSYSECDSAASPASLAPEPEPLSLDCLWEDESNENDKQIDENAIQEHIWYSSDFVPNKRECDILLAGHAYADRPVPEIGASIRIGGFSRSFAVTAAEPSVKIPLHTVQQPHGRAPDERVCGGATPDIPELHQVGFDFSAYNQASKASRVAEISPGMVVELQGLSARSEHLAFQLPELFPCVFVETTRRLPEPLEMRCDTLWLDTDREIFVLLYRGTVFPKEGDSIQKLIVSMEPSKNPRSLEAIGRELARGVFTRTVLRSDLLEEGGGDDEPEESGEVWLARYEAMEETPEPTISLEKYAQISAELAEQRTPRDECLKAHGFNEESFMLEERAWLEKMGNAAMEGDTELATHYGDLFVEAQDRLAGPEEGRETIDEYAALKVEMDEAEDPELVLKAASLSFSAWMRIDRRWTRDTATNWQLKAELVRRIEACRIRRERRLLEDGEAPQLSPAEDDDDDNDGEDE